MPRAICKHVEQITRRFWRVAEAIASGSEIIDQREHARRHVKSDRISSAARCAAIIRHQYRDPPIGSRQCLQSDQCGYSIRNHRDPVGFGSACECGEAKSLVLGQQILECDGPGEHAAIKLGQHDVHCQIGGAETARAVAPGGSLRRSAYDLEHRDARSIERCRLVYICPGSECRHRDDERGM